MRSWWLARADPLDPQSDEPEAAKLLPNPEHVYSAVDDLEVALAAVQEFLEWDVSDLILDWYRRMTALPIDPALIAALQRVNAARISSSHDSSQAELPPEDEV